MSLLRVARPVRWRVIWQSCRYFAPAIILLSAPAPALAHEFGVGQDAYEDFLSGNLAVFTDVPVLLGLIAAGWFSGIWKPDGLPSLWPFYLGGILAGAAVGFWGVMPPTLPAYGAVIVIGLLGAAAAPYAVVLMRGIFVLIGLILTNAVFSGHGIAEIPLFAYVGIAFALNFGVAASAGLVAISDEKLPYTWVPIVWRAGISWLVAIAVMTMVLMTTATP